MIPGDGVQNESQRDLVAAAAVSTAISTVTAIVTTSAAVATISTATAEGALLLGRTVFAGASLAHTQRAAGKILAIELLDGGLGLGIGAHRDEAETAGTVRVPIHNDLDGRNRAALLKDFLQFGFGGLIREVGDVETIAHG